MQITDRNVFSLPSSHNRSCAVVCFVFQILLKQHSNYTNAVFPCLEHYVVHCVDHSLCLLLMITDPELPVSYAHDVYKRLLVI